MGEGGGGGGGWRRGGKRGGGQGRGGQRCVWTGGRGGGGGVRLWTMGRGGGGGGGGVGKRLRGCMDIGSWMSLHASNVYNVGYTCMDFMEPSSDKMAGTVKMTSKSFLTELGLTLFLPQGVHCWCCQFLLRTRLEEI